jgi:hypothetical protein
MGTLSDWRSTGVALALATLLPIPRLDGQTTAQSKAQQSYIYAGSLPAPARTYLLAFGRRLQSPGNERTTLTGTFTSTNGDGPMQIIWQVPGWIVVQWGNNPPLVYDDVVGLQNASGLSSFDTNVLESLFDDSPQSFLYGSSRGLFQRFLVLLR